ncbi:MAG: DUF4159 domain-containing protein [Inquilinus sp.]|nr:DUF4159 domain-containing protein [Inquilinus sp.]
MLTLGPLVFATPWLLLALGILPLIYWLLRVTPPAPRLLRFPAIRLLYDLTAREETPDRTPWWLLLMRLALAAMIILALARPLLNPGADLPGSGPVLLVVDNGWAAARDWPARRRQLEQVIDRADREGRRLIVLPTAARVPGERPEPSGLLRPAEARGLMETLTPVPWPTDRGAALAALRDLRLEGSAHAVWLTDGLDDDAVVPLAQRLQRLGSAEIVLPSAAQSPHLLHPPAAAGAELIARIRRVEGLDGPTGPVWLRVTAGDGRLLHRQQIAFEAGETVAEAPIDLPVELRNQAIRLEIEGETTAGAVALLDERWRRRPVGLIGAGAERAPQPLLTEMHYLGRALEPYSEVRLGEVLDLLESRVAVMVLPDTGGLTTEDRTAIDDWIAEGGVLVRFAGPLLAANPDPLVPVRLRYGDRVLTGTLSWTEPMPLATFDEDSPFHGLAVPPEVLIERQVLAEPSLDLAGKTWARLADGTPLVTAERRGPDGRGGWLVLVHTTAGPEWSNLPISGLFVDMLRRIVAMSEGIAGDGGTRTLKPLLLLDGLGRLVAPGATAVPIQAGGLAEARVGPEHPPGFYGTEEARRALNLGGSVETMRRLQDLPGGVAVSDYAPRGEIDLMPWLLAVALAVAVLDMAIAMALRGLFAVPVRRAAGTAAIVVVALAGGLFPAPAARAQMGDEMAIEAANGTYLAYVVTGLRQVDEVSQAGLDGLSAVLFARTAVEAEGAIGVDVAVDELAFFPLLYWPVLPEQAALSEATIDRLNDYLRNGGTILFDTRDQALGGGTSGPGAQRLRTLTEGLDIPPLEPVPPDHVLTKAFYLMQDFPGRYAGGPLWVENARERVNDGVSSVIIGANDWASAWAVSASGAPSFPVVPGGEQQREMAYRFGVNLVMYTLTGNYKADQVHVPAILERLGQ